ncbi:MAG TPA: T9SS type A sorting domain-containing protein [Bacteroidales bacterium]|jgi:hypothetical protein|nr:T9SS type A sorting domain-containing protein [Bacteroidales bacterium]
MLIKKSFLVFIVIVMVSSTCGAQEWQRTYGNQNVGEMCFSSYSSYGGGFVLGSRLNERIMWLLITDINGSAIFEKTLISQNSVFLLSSINQKIDGGILLTGSHYKMDVEYDLPFIVNLSECHEVLWCKRIESNLIWGYGNRIKENSSGTFILYTRYASINFNEESNQLWGIDSTGHILWMNQIAPNYEVPFNSSLINDFCLTTDGGFLMSGYCYYPDPLNPGWDWLQPLLVKTDSLGNAEWIQPNGLDTNRIGAYYSCIQHNNANYAVGDWYGVSDTTVAPWFNRFSLDGNLEIETILHGDTLNNMPVDIDVLDANKLAMVGKCTHGYYDYIYMGVFTADTLGNLDNSMQNENGAPLEECLVVTGDKKLLCTGYTPIDYYSLNECDAFAIKLNANLEYDSIYTQQFNYDTLCPYPIVSDTIICNCEPFVSVEKAEGVTETLYIYPNPASDHFVINYGQEKSCGGDLWIYNVYGRLIFREELPPGKSQFVINCEHWKPGLYFARLESGGKPVSGKVIVK